MKINMLLFQILCGNKIDLVDSRVITEKEGVDLAKKLGISFLETSAKTAHNVGEVYHLIQTTIFAVKIISYFVKQIIDFKHYIKFFFNFIPGNIC
jgi:GTPase SAR1 family protein